HPNLTTQQAFYVAISRARDRAELVTDDARKLADQLEKVTGERVAALDGVALQAAHETAFGVRNGAERGPDRAQHAPGATERSHEAGHEVPWKYGGGSGAGVETGRDRDGNVPEPGAGRHEGGRDSGRSGHWRDRSHGPERAAAAEKSMEPAQKSVDMDLGM
ncbi:MAG: hypothetical protein OXH50_03380, partial [Gemmatimonadetes bacterium]|nr:hypothetical protein [Gemmatimonadota bacterium]